MPTLEERVTDVEIRLASLEKARPGRKKVPIVAPKQAGVCGIDPSRDSSTCPDAGVYRFQQGCLGTACDVLNKQYYKDYRSKNKTPQEAEVTTDAS